MVDTKGGCINPPVTYTPYTPSVTGVRCKGYRFISCILYIKQCIMERMIIRSLFSSKVQ